MLATVLCARIEGGRKDEGERAAFEAHVRQEIAWFRGRGLVFTPEGFFAAFDGPARAIACARALAGACPRLGRAGCFGLHTGECDLTREGRVAGVAFERARAVCELAARGEVLVSRTVTDLVAGSGVAFLDRGAHPLAAGGDAWNLFAVTSPGAAAFETVAGDVSPQSLTEPRRRQQESAPRLLSRPPRRPGSAGRREARQSRPELT